MIYLCDRGTGTDDMEEKDRRICRSKLRSEVWQLQDSVQHLTQHQVGAAAEKIYTPYLGLKPFPSVFNFPVPFMSVQVNVTDTLGQD